MEWSNNKMCNLLKYFVFSFAFGCFVFGEDYVPENEISEENHNESISEYFLCLYDENELRHFNKQYTTLQTTIDFLNVEIKNQKIDLKGQDIKLINLKADMKELQSSNENHSENWKRIFTEQSMEIKREVKELQSSNENLKSTFTEQIIELKREDFQNLNENRSKNFLTEVKSIRDQLKSQNDDAMELQNSILGELKNMKNQLSDLHKKSTIDHPMSCSEAIQSSGKNGVYIIYSSMTNEKSYTAYCSKSNDGGPAWTVIQRRQDGSEDFYRDWWDYKNGFGNFSCEYWLGLEHIHHLTTGTRHELMIKMQDDDGNWVTARYDNFVVGNESDGYPLQQLGKYSGNAGDSLKYHLLMKFSSKDKDNDNSTKSCSKRHFGAWWYDDCYVSHLNGRYLTNPTKGNRGIEWSKYKDDYSLKYVAMLIRPYSQ